MGKRVFERQEDMEAALVEGGYEEDEVFCLDETWLRVCSPPPGNTEMCACIFWRKDTSNDDTPMWGKVVCVAFISHVVL